MGEAVAVHQLAGGDHACLTFSDPDERLDLVAEFIAGGLGAGQRVIWFTESIPLADVAAQLSARQIPVAEAMEIGQLAAFSASHSWLSDGRADGERMMSRISGDLERALRDGFAGLRVTADMRWATAPVVAAEQLLAFEKQASLGPGSDRLTVMCQYDREVFDSVTLGFAADTHAKTVAAEAYYDTALLRICRQYRPPGIRIAGEIDCSHLVPLQQALAEALRLDETIYVNLYKLQFIDVTAATAIAKAALNLPPEREMIVECSEMVATVLEAVGASQVPQLRIRTKP
ncbi:hypothetical protein Rhe02_01600 [Rhizocola hellebori]|uniref:STAS domain-containing protein n=1 Tax=Rhizocola hellebori TaxID=1392758 RepID=A0A8J3Q258_9ACTN|nr:hypothetical protein Rhe02_01600 [Rhizocola hellebori]